MLLVLALIEYSRKSFFLCNGFELTPTLTGLQTVNSAAPLVVLQEGRREYFGAVAKFANGCVAFQKDTDLGNVLPLTSYNFGT